MSVDDAQPAVKRRQRSKLPLLLSALVVVLLAACGVLYSRYHQLLSKQQATPAAQTQSLLHVLGSSIALPSEQPSVVTVLNKSQLGDPQLMHEAQNGDQMIIYSKAKRVILYRPASHKVIDMFHVDSTQTTASSSAATP